MDSFNVFMFKCNIMFTFEEDIEVSEVHKNKLK